VHVGTKDDETEHVSTASIEAVVTCVLVLPAEQRFYDAEGRISSEFLGF
jgi:hypothetical protein